MKYVIEGGRIYDPAHGVDGDVGRVYMADGRIVVPFPVAEADRVFDAKGRNVLPGGVDMHCHLAGPAIQRGRRLLAGRPVTAEGGRSQGVDARAFPACRAEIVPTAADTARLYSSIGYTTAIDAAISPTGSRPCHSELAEALGLDSGFLLLLGNHELLLDLLDRGEEELARHVVAHLLKRTGALGIKAVNAGGVAHWKRTGRTHDGVVKPLEGRRVSPRAILEFLAGCALDLALPHPLHIHVSKLGQPGNIDVTLETSRCLEGRRHHIAHAAFNVYGESPGGGFSSAAERFIAHLESRPEVSADVGQLWFGQTLTVSGDQEVVHSLGSLTGQPYATLDIEMEGAFGVLPIEYRDTSRIHALQWAVGMELLLLNPDPWRLAFSTDHPNGASFLAFPTLLAQLMDLDVRREVIQRLPEGSLKGSVLPDLKREYSLYEIAIITRAGPARILGLERKGHLGPGADADVVIYDDLADREEMFRHPQQVFHRGVPVFEGGHLLATAPGTVHCVAPEADSRGAVAFRRWMEAHASYHTDQVGPGEAVLERLQVATRGA